MTTKRTWSVDTYWGLISMQEQTCLVCSHLWSCWISDWWRQMLLCDICRQGYLNVKISVSSSMVWYVEQLRNLPLSENIATTFTAIPMYTWNTSEQVVFCPSRVSKPCTLIHVVEIQLKFETVWSWLKVFSDRFCLIPFSNGVPSQKWLGKKTHHSHIKFDSPRCQTALNQVEAVRDAASMNWEWWKACCPSNLDAMLIFFFLELFLQMMCHIITMWKVSSYGWDNRHHL